MPALNALLLRQLRRLDIDLAQPEPTPEQLARLLAHVSRSYEDAEKAQYLMRRAQELSSLEMGQLYLQLKEAQRIAGLGNWSFECAGGQGRWSEECARLLRMDPGAAPPRLRGLLARLHRASRRPLLRAVAAALREGREFELELRLQTADGAPLWICVVGQPARGADGSVQRLLGTVMEITQRKQTELRQQVEHTVAQLLAEAQSPREAMPRILQTLGTALGWASATWWELSGAEPGDHAEDPDAGASSETGGAPRAERGLLQRRASWSASLLPAVPAADDGSERVRLDGGDDLVALAARRGEPVWLVDLAQDAHASPRHAAAAAAGLRAALAFPVHAGGPAAGVIEFYGLQPQEADFALLESARSLGRQIGQFLQRKRVEEHVRHLAFHDALTNLPNRAMFSRQLRHAIARAARQKARLAVLFIDLDRFKVINDTLGHDAGDRLLQEMARRLALSLRQSDLLSRPGRRREAAPGDVLARLGGDEFVVLIEDVADPGAVAHVARKLLAALLVPYRLESQPVHITASIGVALYPDDGRDEHTLMKHADVAMYRTKEAGKNSFRFYSSQMDEHSHALLALESDLRFGLRRGEFRLHYQPKLDLASGRITGAEALLRWQHPTLGLLMPAQFVPLAEETGLILSLGRWVLEQACMQACAWQRAGGPPLRMAVNLSARQFSDEKLLREIAACLARTGMDPALLELEITESAVMLNPDKAVGVLVRLKEMGVRVAIDDFGVGYSSLVQLKRLPIDIIKVDRSFIRDCPDDVADVAITHAVIGIGKSLDLQVVAEGIETQRHLQFVRDCGCNEIQGYLFGSPMPPEDFARHVRQHQRQPRDPEHEPIEAA